MPPSWCSSSWSLSHQSALSCQRGASLPHPHRNSNKPMLLFFLRSNTHGRMSGGKTPLAEDPPKSRSKSNCSSVSATATTSHSGARAPSNREQHLIFDHFASESYVSSKQKASFGRIVIKSDKMGPSERVSLSASLSQDSRCICDQPHRFRLSQKRLLELHEPVLPSASSFSHLVEEA